MRYTVLPGVHFMLGANANGWCAVPTVCLAIAESCFSSPSSNPPVICKASLLDFANTLSAQALPSDGGFDFAQV